MIFNSGNEKSLESILADKGITNAVRCSKCNNLTAFDDEDITWVAVCASLQTAEVEVERGYIECPWCKNQLFVGERQETAIGKMITRKYHTTIEGENYDEQMYEYKNGKGMIEI